MSWKNLPTWLKGGIIIGIIGAILSSLILLFKISSLTGMILFFFVIFYVLIPACAPKCSSGLCPNPNYCSSIETLIIIILSFVFYFLIGALIGFIISKIKSRNIKS
ncbi:MAG: hypothetical protein AABX17_02280 [Nanoarchaeota archaeon]